jgi:hypothetical protein
VVEHADCFESQSAFFVVEKAEEGVGVVVGEGEVEEALVVGIIVGQLNIPTA